MRKFIIAAGLATALLVPSAASAATVAPVVTMDTLGSCNGGTPGSIAVNKGIATFALKDTSAYGVIKMFPTNLKVKDIKTLQFKSLSSVGGGMVYMNVVTDVIGPDGKVIANHKIKYVPYALGTPELGIGSWYMHNVLTSGVRLNDADDLTPAMTWAQAVGQLGNETVNRVSITAGCSMGFGTVQVDKFQVNSTTIDFK
jgi:hypothetical protein